MSRDRQAPSLGWPPADPSDLRDFPFRKLTPDTSLFRAVSQGLGPWWFGSSMLGRFDLPEPEGSCYLASDEISALLEVAGRERLGGVVPAELERFQEETGLEIVEIPRREHLRILGD